jgi:branched-chain amino acid transport system substrate-binding protein
MRRSAGVAAVLALTAAACGSDEPAAAPPPAAPAPDPAPDAPAPAPAPSADPIKLGAIFSASGTYGAIGTESLTGVKFAVDEKNGAGGIDGQQLELIEKDYRSNGDLIVGLANELVRDGVVTIFGTATSGTAVLLDPIGEASSIPILSKGGFNPGGKFSFALDSVSGYFNLAADLAIDRGETVYCTIAINGSSAEAVKLFVVPPAEAVGLEIGPQIAFDPTVTDLTAQATQLREAGCNAIYAGGSGASILVLARAMIDLGMDESAYLMTQGGNATAETLNELGDAEDFVYFALPKAAVSDKLDPADPALEIIEPFVTAFNAANGRNPTAIEATGYSMAQVAFQAMEDGGARTGTEIRDYLISDVVFNTPFLPYTFNDSDLTTVKEPGEFRNGSLPANGDGWFTYAKWNAELSDFEVVFAG